MYSHEIEQVMKERNYNLDSETYIKITQESQQISHVKYDSSNNDFHIWTDDGWYWKFGVYLKEKE